MGKVKVGVFGGRRGWLMTKVMAQHPDADLVAVCDKYEPFLEQCKKVAEEVGSKIATYTDVDDFLNHDMDAIVLANYAHEHAPYAIKCLKSGRHVVSEVLACQTLGEAVALIEAVEESGKVYAYAENYCYFRGTMDMRRRYRAGDIGEFMYGEGEYVHDCEAIWHRITYGERDHWRNWTPSTFYCTHALGPLLTITGTRPVKVTAYETPNVNARKYGRFGSDGAVLLCQMNNGAVVKSLFGGLKRSPESIWYCVYGSKGMMETDRWGEQYNMVNVYRQGCTPEYENYKAEFDEVTELSLKIGEHGGSDFYTMDYFLATILEREGKDKIIDVYQALDMTLPGTLGYKSLMNGNQPYEVPDLRDKSIRDKYRNDHYCVDPRYSPDGNPRPSTSFGNPVIPESVYDEVKKRWLG